LAVERLRRFPAPLSAGRRAVVPLRRAGARVAADTRAPFAAVVIGSLIVAALAARTGVRIGAIALDETLLKQSAVHYGSGLPGTLFHDLAARGTSRLYSLVLAPLFRVLPGDQGVQASRVVNALMFASASIPAYLLASRVTARRWLSAAAALLGVAAPWLIITTAIYGESLTLPLFVWTVWAIERSVRAPSPRRDLAALLLITATMCTRTQFGILFVAYWLCIAGAPLIRGGADALPNLSRRWLRGWPFASALLGLVGLYVVYLAARHRLHYEVQVIFGSYSEIQDRGRISPDMGVGLLIGLVALSLGMGIAPAIVGLGWLFGAARRPARPEWTFAFVALVVGAVFALATIYAQGGYLAERTEERYYFYVVPLLWIAAVAALGGGVRPTRRALAYIGGILALLYASIAFVVPLQPQTSFLAPVLASAGHLVPQLIDRSGLTGLSERDLMFVVVAAVTGIVVLAAGRRRAALVAVLAVPAALQLGWTVYAFAVTRGDVAGVPARTATGCCAAQSWIDRALPGRGNAAWIDNQVRADPAAAQDQQQTTLFWNDEIVRAVNLTSFGSPGVGVPLATLPLADGSLQARDDVLEPAGLFAGPVVQVADSPLLQVAGTHVASSPDGQLELVRAAQPTRARWAAEGLPIDGYAELGKRARLTALGPVRVAVSVVPAGSGTLDLRLGAASKRVRLGTQPATVHLVACGAGALHGTLGGTGGTTTPDGRKVVYRVTSVRVTSVAPGACRRTSARSHG
jgi:hypothetical protein